MLRGWGVFAKGGNGGREWREGMAGGNGGVGMEAAIVRRAAQRLRRLDQSYASQAVGGCAEDANYGLAVCFYRMRTAAISADGALVGVVGVEMVADTAHEHDVNAVEAIARSGDDSANRVSRPGNRRIILAAAFSMHLTIDGLAGLQKDRLQGLDISMTAVL